MKETIDFTQTRGEEALAAANDFMERERGVGIDGANATLAVTERVMTTQEAAETALKAVPASRLDGAPKIDGFYVPLSKYNSEQFDQVRTALAGYMVLLPSSYVDKKVTSELYPAVVSDDGLAQNNALRLHVLKQPYRSELRHGAAVALSAAGQSEARDIKKGAQVVGHHNHQGGDGVEAEHFATLLAASSDADVRRAWASGVHVNHTWRKQPNNSVLTTVNNTLLNDEMPQQTITLKQEHFERGAMILWHAGMVDDESGRAETATKDQALVVVQALGHQAVQTKNPASIDQVKRLLA